MHPDCPVCGVHFEREVGYWSMSIFMGYVLYFFLLAPPLVLMYFLRVPLTQFLIISGVAVVLLAPLVFHYARVAWLHIDEILDPRRDPRPNEVEKPAG